MDETRDGDRTLLEAQLRTLQNELHSLEGDAAQVEPLKSILRACQRLRHEQRSELPQSVRLLRNAVEKVTIHLGEANVAVSQNFLDFYVDTFQLLEDALRRWPEAPRFDRARYADRVRALLETTFPHRDEALEEPSAAAEPSAEPSAKSAEEATPAGPAALEPDAVESAVSAATAAEVPTWSEPRVQVVAEGDLSLEERERFVPVDLRALLVEPWAGERAGAAESARMGARSDRTFAEEGTLAASFSMLYDLRRGGDARGALAGSPPAALAGFRDVLDALSRSLAELDHASERLLREERNGLGRADLEALVERLEAEKEKLLGVFERTIETFRAGAV